MGRWANKYVIGLTGNIATGKSVVRQMVQHLEAYTIDADSLSHRAMAVGAPAYKPIIDTFGQFILDADKNINRVMLGNIVFSNPEALARLEAIVHPVVGGAVNALISRAQQKVIVVEAIKLLEGDLGKGVDEVWVVDAAPETQIKRLIEKRKMSEAEARQRVAAQGAQADKLAKANVVIKNDGNIEDTWKQVQVAWNAVQRRLAGSAPSAGARVSDSATQPIAPATSEKPPQTKRLDGATLLPSTPAPAANITVSVKRGMPTNADALAEFISKASGKPVTRMDIMMSFGQKSYLLAQDQAERVLAVMGWQVENLITRVDEFYMAPNVPALAVIEGLVAAVESASRDLQSEVAYFFLPESMGGQTAAAFQQQGYETTGVEQIKIPAWRESVQEIITEFKGAHIFGKKLREDRVLKPI